MIFIELAPEFTKISRYPRWICTEHPLNKIKQEIIYGADSIFDIKFGVTGYFKDRFGTNYQFTSEEELVLRLKAVPV